jgi:signal transduction histidine kinase
MKRLSIRVRLTVLYGGLFLLAGVIVLGVTYLLVKQSLDAQLPPPGIKVGRLEPPSNDVPLVKLDDGQVVPITKAAEIINAKQEQFRDDVLRSLLTRGGIALLGVGIAAVGFGWLMAERALRPVHEITATARRVAAAAGARRGFTERIALAGPNDEIKELADTFDDMLSRLDRSFDGQRGFVANASHELRTPLAINRALLEVAVTRPDASPDTRQLGETLLAVNARHERLIDGLLMLAESENAVVERSTVDLADIAGYVLDQVPAEGLTVHRDLHPAPTEGDPVLLERLAQNLVENAVRHNEPSGWLSVSTEVVGDRATLVVANSGPVVPPYDVETIFEPFHRLRGDRTGSDRTGSDRGFGLGLSVVAAVARAHGGEVTAEPQSGGGLLVTARFRLS